MLNKLISLTKLHELNLSWPAITPGEMATLILVVSFGILSAVELKAPKEKQSKKLLRQSYKTNFSLFIFNSLIMSLLSAASLVLVAKQHLLGKGLLSAIANPAVKAILSFLAIDLLLYIWHKTCHRFDGLWMFHKVHHNDPCLNVSTGFRIHIIELLITHLLKAALIIGMGIDALIVLVNEVVTTLFIMLHHSNISFKGEKWFGLLFIAPYLHRTHHSTERNEHDSNYGAILSIWDRLFGTLTEWEPAKIGIKGDSPLDFVNLVKFGFTLQMPSYPQSLNLDSMIAEAAYYRAEKRNFYPGQEINDWLEAKKEVLRMVYSNRKNQRRKETNKSQRSYLDWINCTLHLDFGH